MTDIAYECRKCGSTDLEYFNNSVDEMGIFHHLKCNDCGHDFDSGYKSEWWLEEQKVEKQNDRKTK